MEGELKSFIKVWIIATTSLCYCYYISANIPKGKTRLISLIPIFYLFITLPLDLHSIHIGGPTTFFLVWLGTFKLILFSFDQGPLFPLPRNLFQFISITCLPIKIRQNPPRKSPPRVKNPIIKENSTTPVDQKPQISYQIVLKVTKSILVVVLKIILLTLIIKSYEFRPYIHPYITLFLYCCHTYIAIETVLALTALPARTLFGFELEPQFNEPYLTTSLQDFWGRRWNLMVSSVLRDTAYNPVRWALSSILGPRWAQFMGVMASFAVSGLMHEVMYYYLTRARPTWEVTLFFVLHGVCTGIEIAAKRAAGDTWRLHRVVSGVLTLGFLGLTGNWLFFPQLLRNGVDEKTIKEYSLLVDFFNTVWKYCLWW